MNESSIGAVRPASAGEARGDRHSTTVLFLQQMLAGGRLPVAELELKARSARLLRPRQGITDAKLFKAAKQRLGVRSMRKGFGPGAIWFWELPTTTKAPLEPAVDLTPKPSQAVVYGMDHSRPDRHDGEADHHSGGHSIQRAQAPAAWITGVSLLDLARAPGVVPGHRWRQFVSDCQRFVTSRWAAVAAEIGWDTTALFACHPLRPIDYPGAGLLWLTAGGEIIALHKDWAALKIDGAQRVYHRRLVPMNFVLPWVTR